MLSVTDYFFFFLHSFRILDSTEKVLIPRSSIDITAPITKPDKVLCIGMNYIDHCKEQNCPLPVEPVIFNKFPSCIVGPNDNIPYPEITEVKRFIILQITQFLIVVF